MTKQKGLREILRDFYKNYYLGQKVQCNFDDAYLVDKTVRQIKALFIFNKDKTFEILDNLKEYIKWQYDGKKVLHGGNLKTMLLLIDEIKMEWLSCWDLDRVNEFILKTPIRSIFKKESI